MAAVHVGIGHDEYLVVAQLGDVELLAQAAAQRRHNRSKLVVAVNFVDARLFHVEHLAPQRKDSLYFGIAPHLGAAAGGIALHDVDFCFRGVLLTAVRQLAGHTAVFQRRLAAHQLARFFGGLAGTGGLHGFFINGLCHRRIFFKKFLQLVVHDAGDKAPYLGIAQLRLCLSFELRLRQLHADDGCQAFAHVRAGEVVVLLLDITLFTAEIVEHTGERGFKALLMGTAVRSVYIVCKGKDQLVVAVVILKRHFGDGVVKLPLQIYYVRVQHLKLPLLVDVVHKAADAALVAHALLLFLPGALVRQRDAHAGIQERLFAQACV